MTAGEIDSAIHIAATRGDVELIQRLVEDEKVDVNSLGYNGLTALCKAAEAGQVNAVTTLLELGADPLKKTVFRMVALHYAAANGHNKVISAMLNHAEDKGVHIDLNVWDFGERTPLHMAARLGQEVCCSVLLEAGSNVFARNWIGQTPLQVREAELGHEVLLRHTEEGIKDPCIELLKEWQDSAKNKSKGAFAGVVTSVAVEAMREYRDNN